jgi:hypothetical protein
MVLSGSALSDGPQRSAAPVVGCPHETTVRPPGGDGSSGAATKPETTMSLPSRSVER